MLLLQPVFGHTLCLTRPLSYSIPGSLLLIVHNSDSFSHCARGDYLSFLSLSVPNEVTSAFGVFRECFDFLFGPSTLGLGFPWS